MKIKLLKTIDVPQVFVYCFLIDVKCSNENKFLNLVYKIFHWNIDKVFSINNFL